jgi:hypothetical protein
VGVGVGDHFGEFLLGKWVDLHDFPPV